MHGSGEHGAGDMQARKTEGQRPSTHKATIQQATSLLPASPLGLSVAAIVMRFAEFSNVSVQSIGPYDNTILRIAATT